MARRQLGGIAAILAASALTLAIAACAGRRTGRAEPLLPPETFTWVAQPITFSPPPPRWERQGDNSGGTLGVRFILSNGGGQCISVAAFRSLAQRDRRQALAQLISSRDSLTQREFLRALSLARARTDDPISEREVSVAMAINAALDLATTDVLNGNEGSVADDLEAALRASSSYQPTLADLIPRLRLQPARMQEPERWRIGTDRDTLLAGLPAYVTQDTLIAPEQTLLYHEVFWVVDGCAFKATYQGRPENLQTFHRVVDSIQFPGLSDAAAQ